MDENTTKREWVAVKQTQKVYLIKCASITMIERYGNLTTIRLVGNNPDITVTLTPQEYGELLEELPDNWCRFQV